MRTAFLTTSCVALALGLAACGSESGAGGDADPASLVPAAVPMYFEATIRPEGEQREDVLAAAGKIMRTDDPAGKIRELVDDGFEDDDLTWERDFAPWVGERAGVWATDSPARSNVVGIISVRDEDAAAKALPKLQDDGERKDYKGNEYILDDSGTAAGLVDGFMVVGEPQGFQAVIDAQDGDRLAESERYGTSWTSSTTTGSATTSSTRGRSSTRRSRPIRRAPRSSSRSRPSSRSTSSGRWRAPSPPTARASTSTRSSPTCPTGRCAGSRRSSRAASQSCCPTCPAMPGRRWRCPKAGEGARELVNSFGGLIGGAALNEQVKRETGLDLEADVYSWLGDVGAFVRGTTRRSSGARSCSSPPTTTAPPPRSGSSRG